MHHNLLFDLDQTLLDFHASERLGVKFVMEQKGLEFTEELYQSFKQINKSLWLEFEKGSITKPELFVTRFRRLFEQCGCDTDKMDLERINSDFIDHMSHHGVLGTHGVYFDDEKKTLSFDVLVDFTVRDKAGLCKTLQEELAPIFPGYAITVNFDTDYTD